MQDEHYDTFVGALRWTPEQGLGEGFTDEVKEARTAAYVLMAGVMKEAAAAVEAEQASPEA